MRRVLAFLAAAVLGFGAAAQSVDRIRDVGIRVEVQQDGSAWITQVWDVEVNSSGTEWYMPVSNLGSMTVSGLQVSENGTPYEALGEDWDIHRSRSWKEGKCGIVPKDNGVELCWGLGQEGWHQWTARFYVTGLVQAYDDADAFNFMFVNRGLSPAPEHVRVTIVPAFECPEWTLDNTRVWGFGFYGDINVVDGTVVEESSESLSSSSAVIGLVKFEKGLFQPAVVAGGPFQDLLDRALDGSAYGEDGPPVWFLVLFGLCFLGFLGICVFMVVASALGYKWSKKLFGTTKIDGWYRDVPLEGNLLAAEYLLVKGKRFGTVAEAQNIIGAMFLRWIMNGDLVVQPDAKDYKRVNLLFKSEKVSADDVEQDLFDWARSAAGDNLLLEKNEFEKWSKKNAAKMAGWPDRAVARGKTWFHDKGYFGRDGVCTPQGAAEARHVVEFRNFLKDFTLSDQRGANEVSLWKEYLVYAQLYGIADRVAQQFKKLYPAEFAMVAQSSGMDVSTMIYTMNWTNSMSTRAFNNASQRAGSISGTGGHTSFGGGGGFSGGGFGGGAR